MGSGVYRVAGAPRTWRSEVMSAVLLAGSGDPGHAAASHGTALHLLDPGRFPRPPKVEVSVEHGRRATAGGAAVHHARDLLPDVTTVDGISCTTGVRTTIDRAAALDAAGLPARETNVVLVDARGRIREVDVLFRKARLVVEWDGLRFHSSAAQRRRDRAGDRRLVIARYRVLRFECQDVRTRTGHVAEEVRAALAG